MLDAQDRMLEVIRHQPHLPYPTRQILFHDQTEATDGNRRQREG
jgi:hypothetical protein